MAIVLPNIILFGAVRGEGEFAGQFLCFCVVVDISWLRLGVSRLNLTVYDNLT